MHIKYVVLFTVIIFFSALTHASNTAELSLNGRISPSSCMPNFVGGGTVDVGQINKKILQQKDTSTTSITGRQVQLSISCDAPQQIFLKWTDNRNNTAYEGLFALASGNKHVGNYSLNLSSITGDGKKVSALSSSNEGALWTANPPTFRPGAFLTAFTDDGKLVPRPFKNLQIDFEVKPNISSIPNLVGFGNDITSKISYTGLATVEVLYL